MFSPCVIIPCFNHSKIIRDIVETIVGFEVNIIIVDDGSDDESRRALSQLAHDYSETVLLYRSEHNQGKGVAVMQGIRLAAERGYSHALQVDADGQHNLEDIPMFLEAAKASPEAIIAAVATYDDSVPRARYWGRYITHVWVWIETLSFRIKDSMSGFRVYPVEKALRSIERYSIGKRMDFDTDIIVRMYWDGADVINIPTRITYPDDGTSHFRLWRDNLLISRMHTRLFFGMLLRVPKLLWRHL